MKEKVMGEISETLLKGRITELRCELWFLEHGFLVSTPELPYQYDFIVDKNGKLVKIQVKTSHYDDGGFCFNTSSMTHNANGYTQRLYSEDAVDYFMTVWENECYLVPFSQASKRATKIRTEPTKSGQKKGIKFAEDFLAEKIFIEEEVVE